MPKISTRDWQGMATAIEDMRDFECHGAVKGKAGNPKVVGWSTARLHGDMLDRLNEDVMDGRVDYVIYSYATPMAWRVRPENVWVHNRRKYSVTTTRHQTMIAAAIGRATGEF